MPNDMPIYNTLTPLETRIVQSMRHFCYDRTADEMPPADDAVIGRIQHPLHRFLALLWQSDPHVVALNHKWDPEVSAFEVHVLYAVSAARADNGEIINELLHWWFPDDLVAAAHTALNTVARMLNDTGAPKQSCARLREHILCLSSQRVKPASFVFIDPDTSLQPSPDGHNETIH